MVGVFVVVEACGIKMSVSGRVVEEDLAPNVDIEDFVGEVVVATPKGWLGADEAEIVGMVSVGVP